MGREPKVYIDGNDWWIGVYRGPHHWYVCVLPCVVIRFRNKKARADLQRAKAGWPDGISFAARDAWDDERRCGQEIVSDGLYYRCTLPEGHEGIHGSSDGPVGNMTPSGDPLDEALQALAKVNDNGSSSGWTGRNPPRQGRTGQ